MKLHFRKYGQGKPLIILHGLFGSSDNWHSLARRWGKSFEVYAVDQRNHGSSPHESVMDYEELTQDLHAFLQQEQIDVAHFLGHSMGGKVAMAFATRYPDHVESLIILDIGIGRVMGKHGDILQALRSINPDEFSSRSAIEQELEKRVASPSIRQFLLKNILRRVDNTLAWKFNRDALLEHYDELTSGLDLDDSFLGSVLFIRGETSDYLESSLSTEILQYFPMAQIETIQDAGHWLHADHPDVLSDHVLNFLAPE